ncbi:hypothetical protein KI688_008832 [Linnemannia hyalina]|uniref:Uncharacterized protein n=1 Tax=Linnemannia hyalina TaxID=64524 RepID=A0A9P8BLQ7_9FUNG|nr:hypothetical protein KI688_008832 [Linnemannia hyalina]
MDMIAALNKPDFGNFARASKSPACGQCLQVVGPNGTVTVQVVDMMEWVEEKMAKDDWKEK